MYARPSFNLQAIVLIQTSVKKSNTICIVFIVFLSHLTYSQNNKRLILNEIVLKVVETNKRYKFKTG